MIKLCRPKPNKVCLGARLVLVICLLGSLQTRPAFACRYNVRETGFVDLGIEPYYLFGYVNKDTGGDIVSGFRQTSHAALMDSNVRVEIIDTDQQKGHPAMKYLDSSSTQTLPAAVLVSPDGQSLAVPITGGSPEPNRPFQETLRSALDHILSSPKREEILQKVAENYGVVLLIEGADDQENKRAKEVASAAIEHISSQMELMPKPIAHPPVQVVIDSKSLAKEKVLLWSLNLDPQDVNEPYAAVLYGKARWIGPLFKGPEITESNLATVLFVIGDDCECGLDYRWLQGTMLPAKWDQKLQARAAESLGFDPENPMIKMEISSIIGRSIGASSYPGVPFGYQELVVESESFDDVQQTSPDQVEVSPENTTTPKSSTVEPTLEPHPLAEGYSSFRNAIMILIGLCILVLISGVAILAKAKRR